MQVFLPGMPDWGAILKLRKTICVLSSFLNFLTVCLDTCTSFNKFQGVRGFRRKFQYVCLCFMAQSTQCGHAEKYLCGLPLLTRAIYNL